MKNPGVKGLILALSCAGTCLVVLLVAAVVAVVGAVGFSTMLHPTGDLENVSREEALAAGYSVPEGASNVWVKDRSLQDVRSTWFRFALEEERRVRLAHEYADHHACDNTPWSGDLPSDWPPIQSLKGFDTPVWWAPVEGSSACTRSARGSGAVIVFADDGVFQLLWTWEHWEPGATN